MFITYEELEDSEAARRERASRQEAEPGPADVPYYRPGKPDPLTRARYWEAKALRLEREVKALRQQQRTATIKEKQR